MKKDKMLKAALLYAKMDMCVFPVEAKGKKPLIKGGFKNATTNQKQIKQWWERWPQANIGISTGQVSGVFVLDIDLKKDVDGFQALKKLKNKHGVLPKSWLVKTGSGGAHIYFKMPAKTQIKNSVSKIGEGLDIRGDGGYIIAPPSVHQNGKSYRLSKKSTEQIAGAPKWLIKLSREESSGSKSKKNNGKTQSSKNIRDLIKGVKEGARNDTIARLSGYLLRLAPYGLPPETSLELLLAVNDARCKPPLPHDEVMKTVNSIAGLQLEELKGGKK